MKNMYDLSVYIMCTHINVLLQHINTRLILCIHVCSICYNIIQYVSGEITNIHIKISMYI